MSRGKDWDADVAGPGAVPVRCISGNAPGAAVSGIAMAGSFMPADHNHHTTIPRAANDPTANTLTRSTPASLPFFARSLVALPIQPELRHRTRQQLQLLAQAVRRGGGFFDQRGVLLRHVVELVDGTVDLADA
eukprot:m.921118 g.921118  ORF g.921118 m.921118 type:complete len:133 (-) comp79124_c0_seq1:92-490(-)